MCNRTNIERTIPAAIKALGGLEALVNDAGTSGPTTPVEEFDPAARGKVMQIKLNGTFDVTRLAIPHLKQSATASIITMSRVAGRFDHANRSTNSPASGT